jgi:hypothetical protein
VYPSKVGYAQVQQQKSRQLELKQAQSAFTCHKQETWNLYALFTTSAEWRTVALATKQRLGKNMVEEWIKRDLLKVRSFQSVDYMWKLIDILPDALGSQSWKTQSLLMMEEGEKVEYPFYYCNAFDCVQLLLRHLLFKNNLVWAPVRQFSDATYSERLYSDMHTAEYW